MFVWVCVGVCMCVATINEKGGHELEREQEEVCGRVRKGEREGEAVILL